jgi:hypothetical protein
VLGILALLSLFAISFASVTRVERTASQNYVDGVRANLAARAGIAAGIAGALDEFRQPPSSQPNLGLAGYLDPIHEINPKTNGTTPTISVCSVGINPGDQVTLRGGAGLDEVRTVVSVGPGNTVTLDRAPAANRTLLIPMGATWYYHGHTLNPQTTGNGIPVALSLWTSPGTGSSFGVPSFNLPTTATLAPIANRVSGATGGTYFADPSVPGQVAGGDIYAIKLLDAQGMLDANMEVGNPGGATPDLQSILPTFGQDVIAEVKAISDAIAAGDPTLGSAIGSVGGTQIQLINNYIPLIDPTTGNPWGNAFTGANVSTFLNYRKALSGGRFRSKEQLKGAFYAMANGNAAMGEAWFTIYRDYFTCYGDHDTNATLGDDPMGTWSPTGGISGPLPLNANGVVDVTNLLQNSLHQAPPRMTVDVNTAPFPVLVAILSTIRGRPIPPPVTDPNAQALPQSVSLIPATPAPMAPYPTSGSATITQLSRADAQAIATALIQARPFRSWHEVYQALNTLHGGAVSDPSLATAIAATCPVNLPLELNPDRSLLYWDTVDPDAPGFSAFPVNIDKASTHSCADFSFTSGTFEVEALGRIYANPTAPFIVAEAYKRCVVNLGSVTWVRGERDLASQLPPNSGMMGAPAVDPNNSYVGGWVQPKPQTSGLNADAGMLTFQSATPNPLGPLVNQFTPDLADGLVMQRQNWAPPAATNTPDVIRVHSEIAPTADDAGEVELWVKEPFDVDSAQTASGFAGTNEALFMNVRIYPVTLRHSEYDLFSTADGQAFFGENGPLNMGGGDAADIVITQTGMATRLERYGNQLYFCRFYWGFPDGASIPKLGEYQFGQPGTDAASTGAGGIIATAANPLTKYPSMLSYIVCPTPVTWKAGTWHHVEIAWNVNQMKMWVDGADQGPPTTPATFAAGHIWEKTVNGFFPSGSSVDPNNQFANLPQNPANEAYVEGQSAAAQGRIAGVDSGSQSQIAKDNQVIADANQWLAGGGGTGHFASDVEGDTFTAELGLRRMELRSHLPLLQGNMLNGALDLSDPPLNGPSESYFLGYKIPDPYVKNGLPEPPQTLVVLNLPLGLPLVPPSYYYRYTNGTYDGLVWTQRPGIDGQGNPTGPTPTPHRYAVNDSGNNGTYTLSLNLPVGCTPVSHGYHVILAHGVFPNPDGTVFGGGSRTGLGFTNHVVTLTTTFPQGNPLCNVDQHRNANPPYCFVPGSDEVPWAIGGAWVAYEKPVLFLEGEEVD